MIAARSSAYAVAIAALGCVAPTVEGHHVPVGEPCRTRDGAELPCGRGAECVWGADELPTCMRSCDPQYWPLPCGDGSWCSHHESVCYLGGDEPIGAACDTGRQECVREARCARSGHATSGGEAVCRALCNPFRTELCAAGERCLDGLCIAPCTGPGDCRAGYVCRRGRCDDALQAADCTGDGDPDCAIGQQCGCLDGSTCERIVCYEPDPSIPP